MYTPDRVFMKDLKALDKNLGCHYNQDLEKFVVTYKKPVGDAVPICLVKSEGGGFRQPDKRDIAYVSSGDLSKETMKQKLDKTSRYMEDSRALSRKKAKSDIRDMTKDNKIQLSQTLNKVYGSGKANSVFRRVKVKPKGDVF